MPKGLRIKWDHRTPSDERTADNLRMGTALNDGMYLTLSSTLLML